MTDMNEDLEKYSSHYNENELWEKLRKFAKKAGIKVTYAALLLYYVLKNPATSGKDRATGSFLFPQKGRLSAFSGIAALDSPAAEKYNKLYKSYLLYRRVKQ